MRVLVVEDEPPLARAVARGLRAEGMAVDIALDGGEALAKAAVCPYEVIVLDRDLPVVHGDEVCRQLIAGEGNGRVLMLTAAREITDRIDGLNLGADDYLAKPFAFGELLARVRALGRRAHPAHPPMLIRGDLAIDTVRRLAYRRGERLDLSKKELAVLEILVAADGAVVSGPPITAEQAAALFEPFRRLHADRVGSARGSGLGLSIVRAVARAHAGEATASPVAGGGLRVTVTLPAARPAAVTARPEAAVGAPPPS